MCCLRCAGAPRRPASGSALYLLDPSQHVDLYVPGEPLAANIQFLHEARLPSPRTVRLGTPNVRRCRGLLVHHCYDLLSCSPPLRRLLLPGFQRVRSPSPVAGYNYGGNWTIPPTGLPPAGSAASVAAPALDLHEPNREHTSKLDGDRVLHRKEVG